jgi:MacB-like periplasmic core domain
MIVPLGDNVSGSNITIPGHVAQRGEELHADRNAASPDYFKTMNIALLLGRDFLDSDTESSPRVAVINEVMAQRFWPGLNPVGQNFKRSTFRFRRTIPPRKPCRFSPPAGLRQSRPRSYPWLVIWRPQRPSSVFARWPTASETELADSCSST